MDRQTCSFPVNLFQMHRDFSEDEEEAFVAEFDSSTTENTGESDLNTVNVTSSNTRTEKVVPCFSPGGVR